MTQYVFWLVLIIHLRLLGINGHCIDIHSQVVSQGLHYVPGPNACTLCICDKGSPKWCKSVLCSPPQNCKSFQVGNSCCEFKCLDDILTNDSYKNTYDLALRLIASAVTAVLSLSLLFFLFHRLRRRKIRLRCQNRQISDDQRSLNSIGYIAGSLGYLPGSLGYLGSGSHELEFHYEESGAHYSLWKPPGNYFPRGEAPPPYEEAVRSAQAENETINNQIRVSQSSAAPPAATSYSSHLTQGPGSGSHQQQNSCALLTRESTVEENSSRDHETREYVNIPLITSNVQLNHSKSTVNVININTGGPLSRSGYSLQESSRRSVPHSSANNSKSKSFENIVNVKHENQAASEPRKQSSSGNRSLHKQTKYENVPTKTCQVIIDSYKNTERLKRLNASKENMQYVNINTRHRTIPNKDLINMTEQLSENLLRELDKSSNEIRSIMRTKECQNTTHHHTLPKNLREPTIPNLETIYDNRTDPENSHNSLPKYLKNYNYPVSIMKSVLADNCGKSDLPSSSAASFQSPSCDIRIDESQFKHPNPRHDEKSYVSYHSLNISQDDDDYRSECENCKSSGLTSMNDEEADVVNETMTLQRRPLEQGEELPYYRTSLTLPTNTRKPRILTVNPGRESWFLAMQETSSSDEST